MDGVIIDHSANKIAVAKKFGFKLTKKETPSDSLKLSGIIPKSVWDKIQVILFDHPEIALKPRLMPGVVTVLKELKDKNIPYFLISRRKKRRMALELLKSKSLWPKYFNDKNTFFVQSPEEKNEKSAKLKVTHYFDDQPSVLEKLSSVKNRYLFDNLNVAENSAYNRVKSWKEISELI